MMFPGFNDIPEETKADADKRAFTIFYLDENNKRVYIWWNRKLKHYDDTKFALLYPEGQFNGWGKKKPSVFPSTRKAQNAIDYIYKNFPEEFKSTVLRIGLVSELENASVPAIQTTKD